jgi:glycosyltransferase involved in cell wall biosynthesis
MPVNSDGYVKEIIQFPKTLRELRFDPISLKSKFNIDSFKIKVISDSPLEVLKSHRIYGESFVNYDPKKGYSLGNSKEYTYFPLEKSKNIELEIESLTNTVGALSIIVPVYNTEIWLLEELCKSVFEQWYQNWELIFVDDASSNSMPEQYIVKLNDSRVKYLKLESNLGIAGATNKCLELASSNYVVFLDHDDLLTTDCLYELAKAIESTGAEFIYSDEDKIDESGYYVQPHFKPKWSPDTMMSTMYTCHVMCIKRSLILDVGGLHSEYDGCQDWDLVLRITEKTDNIHHISKVLYHWRIIPASIADSLTAKPAAVENARLVREHALVRRNIKGTMEEVPVLPGFHRVNYLPINNPLVSIIIPTRDNKKILENCITSILNKTSYQNFEVLILDNGSIVPECTEYLYDLALQEKIKVLRHDAPFNYSELNNLGVSKTTGELLLFLNDDTEVLHSDWLERLVGYAQQKHIGCVGTKLLYPGGELVQHSGVVNLEAGPGHAFLKMHKNAPGYFARNLLEYNYLAVTGACLMVERAKFNKVGGFNEGLPIAYNDVELCMSMHENGFYNVVCQGVELIHHESISRGVDELSEEKMQRLKLDFNKLFELHPYYFQTDPFHNPNLHPNSVYFDVF